LPNSFSLYGLFIRYAWAYTAVCSKVIVFTVASHLPIASNMPCEPGFPRVAGLPDPMNRLAGIENKHIFYIKKSP
jgi:hypothetical protein